ncbi:hypothetical protein [Agromyces sp. NPDC058110]|uniref:hypothetical protein n=1 Tax=Agromyces sp. NPDC058110 TaxID=3346345 RepID=UPI0036DD3FF0
MVEITHGVMLLGATAGTAAALAPGRRVRALDAVAGVVMAAAMLDSAFTHVLPGLGWAVALVATGIAVGIRARRDIRRPEPLPRCGRPLADLHHALALIATGWLMAGAGAGAGLGTGVGAGASASAASAAPTALAATAAHHAGPVLPLQATAVLAVVALGTYVAIRAARSGRAALRHGTMAAGMSLMLAAMAAPATVVAFGW